MRVLCFQISTSCRKPLLTPSVNVGRQLLGHLLVKALGLLDDDAPLQHERVLADRIVAVDQDRLGLVAAVVVVQPVDHERRPEVRRLRIQVRLAVGGTQVVHVGPAHVVQVLRGDVALEDVLEVRRQTEVDVEEVRHVGDVVDDLAAIGALDEHPVPLPVRPLVARGLRNLGDPHLLPAADCPRGRARRTKGRRARRWSTTGCGPAAACAWRRAPACTCRRRPSASRGTGRPPRRP